MFPGLTRFFFVAVVVLQFAFNIIHESRTAVALLLPCIILNTNRRTINGGGPATRLMPYFLSDFVIVWFDA